MLRIFIKKENSRKSISLFPLGLIVLLFFTINCNSVNDDLKGGFKYSDQLIKTDSSFTDSLEQDFFNNNKIKVGPVNRE